MGRKPPRPRTADTGITARLVEIGGVRPFRELVELERQVRSVLDRMTAHGLGVDVAVARGLMIDLSTQIGEIRTRHPGVNLASSKQVARYLRAKRMTIAHDHPVARDIHDHRQLVADRSFVRSVLRSTRRGRVHPHHDSLGAATGRIVTTSPALGSMPKRSECGRRIRGAFVAGPGRVFVRADWRQVELRIAAAVSGDQALLKDFRSGRDPLAMLGDDLGISRDQAKTLTYRVLYGSTAEGVAEALRCKVTRARDIIAGMFSRFTSVAALFATVRADAQRDGGAWSHGRLRRRALPAAQGGKGKAKALRQATSQAIQGTGADILKRALVLLSAALPGDCSIVLAVHDEIVVDALAVCGVVVGRIMTRCMLEAAGELGKICPFEVEASVGPTLLDQQPLDEYQPIVNERRGRTYSRRVQGDTIQVVEAIRVAPAGDLDDLDPHVSAAVQVIQGALAAVAPGERVDLRDRVLRRLCGTVRVDGVEAYRSAMDWLRSRGDVVLSRRKFYRPPS